MRTLGLALCLSLGVTAIAVAQDEAPLMPTPPPTDFTKPFQYDRAPFYFPGSDLFIRGKAEDTALPVEVIGRHEPYKAIPEVQDLVRNLRAPYAAKAPAPKDKPPVHCFIDPREPIDEGRALSCNGSLYPYPAAGPVQ